MIEGLADTADQAAQTARGAAVFARDLRWLAWAVIALGGSYLVCRIIEVLGPRVKR